MFIFSDKVTPLERANSITHGLGALLSVLGLIFLVLKAAQFGQAIDVVSASIYGATMIVLYSASTFYHAALDPKRKHVLHIMDHVSIYLLIAGTYTPICLGIGGPWGWGLFAGVWAVAILGLVFKFFFWGRFDFLHVAFYLLMGWMIMLAYKPIFPLLPDNLIYWAVAGGLAYSLGTIFYMSGERIPFGHAIWHLFVLGGSAAFFIGIYNNLLAL